MKYQKAMTPDKPFFVYFAPGATHAPHHVPEGVDRQVERASSTRAGTRSARKPWPARSPWASCPPAPSSPPSRPAIKDWDKLSADEKRLFTRQAEVFAAFLDYTDHEIGRMLDAIEETGQLDNTLVFYIAGDNGTSAEGGMNGMFNEYTYFNGVQEKVEDMLKHRQVGRPETYPHMAAGWAVAFNSPFTGPSRWPRLRRHPQRHGGALAEGHQGKGEIAPSSAT
jgi:arylsulfatase A-like enzyme